MIALDDVKRSTLNSDQWCTGQEVCDGLEEFFGGPVGTDPCSNSRSLVWARRSFTIGGLHLPWGNGTRKFDDGFENPPYSSLNLWSAKGVIELRSHHINELVRLVPVAISTTWWRMQCGIEPIFPEGATKPIFAPNPRLLFTKRLKFIGDVQFGARFDSVLVYYGRRERAFDKAFSHLMKWTSYGRSTKAR